MPRVPKYEKQVQDQGMPRVRTGVDAPLSAFGGGQSLTNLVNTATDLTSHIHEIQVKEKIKADEAAVLNADFQLAQKQSLRENEVSSFRGQKAIGVADTYKKTWDQDISEIESTLVNPEQKEMFQKRAMARSLLFNDSVLKHESKEMETFYKDTTEGMLLNAQRDAAAHPYDPARIAANLEQQRGYIEMYGRQMGEAPEMTKSKVAAAVQTTHMGVVDRLIANEDFDLAESYLNGSQSHLTGDQVRAAKSLIEAGRKQKTVNKKEAQDRLEQELFMRTLPGAENPLRLAELNSMAAGGILPREMYDHFVGRLTNINNDPTIPFEEKVARRFDLGRRFAELNGAGWGNAEIDETTFMPVTEARGNRLDQLKEFRKFVSESAPYITKEDERAYLMYTQADFNEAQAAKAGLFRGLIEHLRNLSGRYGADVGAQFITPMLEAMAPDVPVEKANEIAANVREKANVAANPNRTRYTVGQIITNANGLKAKVTGYDAVGNPTLELVR